MRYLRKLHNHRAPPGLERTIWRKLPFALVGSIAIPLALSAGIRLFPPQGSVYEIARMTKTVDISAIALGLTALTAVFTVAIGCVVVMIMKGPAYVADGYRLETARKPAPVDKDNNPL